ncbi:MAG: hypothetical protein AAB261_05575 [Chloroflexota bacterium]
MTLLLLVVIIFVAALLQSLSGFAFALITMPLVALVVGIRTATPLVAVAAPHPCWAATRACRNDLPRCTA